MFVFSVAQHTHLCPLTVPLSLIISSSDETMKFGNDLFFHHIRKSARYRQSNGAGDGQFEHF
jgi:hypothetical protein